MNNRGQIGVAIIVAITIFIIGMASMNFVRDSITDVRLSNALDCSNSSISDGTKLTCLVTDITLPYFILIFLGAAGGVITAKLLL